MRNDRAEPESSVEVRLGLQSREPELAVVSDEFACTIAQTLRILDRYIFGQVFVACLGAIGFFTFILLTGNVLRELLGFILSGQLTWWTALPLIGLLIPFVIVYTLPMGMLCGILLVLGRLSAESETIAMRAAGQSLARISAPIYVLAAMAVAAALAINLYYMPLARTRQKQELQRLVRGDPLKIIVPKTFVREFRGCVIYVYEKKGDGVRDVWFWQLDREQRVIRFLRAESGRLELDEANNQILVTLHHAWQEEREKNPEDYQKPPINAFFQTWTASVSLDRLFGGQQTFRRKVDWFTLPELLAEDARLSNPDPKVSDGDRERLRMKVKFSLQERLSTAFTVLSFALIAVPLGIKVSRRETSANLGVALLLALAYYFLTAIVQWLDGHPEIRPDLLLWGPNIIFAVVAIWLHRRAERA